MAQFTRSTARTAVAQRDANKRGPRAPNKIGSEFRNVVQRLLEKNVKNVERWLGEVGDGCEKKGIPADPAKALDLIAKLAEYAAPKLQRTEVMPGDSLRGPPVTQIAISFVDGRAPSAPPLTLDAAPGTTNVVLDAHPAKSEPAKATRKRAPSKHSTLIE